MVWVGFGGLGKRARAEEIGVRTGIRVGYFSCH